MGGANDAAEQVHAADKVLASNSPWPLRLMLALGDLTATGWGRD
jgi:hypothetical protein